jgi:NMT1-like family
VDAAFVQGGVDTDTGERSMVASLGSVAYEPVWLFYREADARERRDKTRLNNLSQLAGWRINTGPSGGGAGPLFLQLAQANHLEATQLQLGEEPAVHAVVDLLQGRTDAVLMVAAADAPLVQYLLRAPGIRLFEFVQSQAYARRCPFLRAVTLPRGIIDLAADKPPQDVRLVAATASLVVREDLHPALVQLLVQAAQQVHGDAGWFSRAGEFPSPSVSDLPLAPEAARLYRDGVPWLQRYLPFWLANFIDRMWFVLLPLVAVMIPLSRILPPLVELRVRSRVFRWYAHLRAVEQALERQAPAMDRLRAEIERIDGQVERIGVPLSYTHELYELRSHIDLVRKRILDRGTVGR